MFITELTGIGMYGNITMPECSCLFVSFSSQAFGPRIDDRDQPGGVHQGSSLPASPVLCLLSLSASLLSALLLSLSFCVRRNGCELVRRCLGRMAVVLSPHGVASFVHARLGCRGNRVAWSASLPSPGPHTCSGPITVPHVPSPPPGLRLPSWRASWRALSVTGVRL